MRLYHRTTRGLADTVLREGFTDADDTYLTSSLLRGVWLADAPGPETDSAQGDTVIVVEIPDELWPDWAGDYALPLEAGTPYREYLVPAAVVNECPRALWSG